MAAVTVPGVGGETITYTGVFDTTQNQTLAQAIANTISAYLEDELTVTAGSDNGTVFVPPGDSFVADDSGDGSFTIVGAQNFIGGGGNLTVWDAIGASSVGGGVDTITAGNGNDLFGLIPGSTYTVAAGNGNDTFYANGSGAIADGTGSNLIFVGDTGGTNLVLSNGRSDTIAAGAGANTVATYGSDPLIFGGSGSLEAFGNAATNETVVGGSGPETIFGASSGVYFLGSSTSLFIGDPSSASTIVGTTGKETVFGGASSREVIFSNSSSLVFANGSNDSATIVGGSSPSTLFGAVGSSIAYFSTSSAGGVLYAAGSGNETLNAAGSSANMTIFGGQDPAGGDSLVGGSGHDVLVAGSGSDTMTGSTGSNVFIFDKGEAGGHDFITDYNGQDMVGLFGYGSGAGTAALAAATVAGDSTTIALSDSTKITFENITTPSSIKIFST
jgi:Ca2+-binding RTX toxin-like protein